MSKFTVTFGVARRRAAWPCAGLIERIRRLANQLREEESDEVGDDFDIDAPGAFRAVENDYFGGEFGSEDEIFEEVLNWDVEHIRLSEASK